MRIQRVIHKMLRIAEEHVQAVADADVAVSANVAEEHGQTTTTHVRSQRRIVQRSGSSSSESGGDARKETR